MASNIETRRSAHRRASEYVSRADASEYNAAQAEKQAKRQLISKFGTRHTEHILRNWSPGALRAFGIRPASDRKEGA